MGRDHRGRIARKKLKAAVWAVLRPGGGLEEAAADLAALWGVPIEAAKAALAAEAPAPEALLLPEALRSAVRLFCAALGQWRTAGMSGVILGFDLAAVDVAARWLGLTPSPELLADLHAMEAEALAVLRSQS